MLASTSRGPSPFSLQATTRALHTHTLHCHTNTYSSTRSILRGNSGFHTRETPNGAYFHVGKYPTGHKTQILRFHQRDSPDFESLLGVIDGLITGPLPLSQTDTGRYRLRPYTWGRFKSSKVQFGKALGDLCMPPQRACLDFPRFAPDKPKPRSQPDLFEGRAGHPYGHHQCAGGFAAGHL